MEEWIKQVFDTSQFSFLVLPAGLLLGLLTAFASLGCSAPMMAAIIGYAGTQEGHRRDIFMVAIFFMVGSILALSIAGAFAGFVGQAAGSALGMYGKILVAVLTISLGFAAFNILPFHLPSFSPAGIKLPRGLVGASVFGLAVGGASTSYTMACCGPVMLPIVLGLSVLRSQGGWGALILAAFAVGYSLPMVATILGIGLGRMSRLAGRITKPVRLVSGTLLVGSGFWLLLTL